VWAWMVLRYLFGSSGLVQAEPDCRRSFDPLRTRLDEVVQWCSDRAISLGPRECLRSDRLRPRTLQANYADAVSRVAIQRRLYTRHPFTPAREREGLRAEGRTGRLLAYFPDLEPADSAAEVDSEGFFDAFNAPPWDTWVGFFRDGRPGLGAAANYLVAWVPAALLANAARGMSAHSDGVVQWLDDTEVGLLKRWPQLRALALTGFKGAR
jgi:hypothetical protein